jgi:hypothetical protein
MPRSDQVVVDVGDAPVRIRTTDAALLDLLEHRFRRFLKPSASPVFELDIAVESDEALDPDVDLRVWRRDGRWILERGDFRAEWSIPERRGWIHQTRNPYAIDSALRILHTLLLSTQGGFLLHASSVVRRGRAYLFTGPSGAGKSTIVNLAPDDVTVLTDEISYLRRATDRYVAFGTPFAGELSETGEPVRAPVAALFRLDRGTENRHDRLNAGDAVRTLMRNILFFADDGDLTARVLDTACDFAARVPSFRLAFAPDARVWSTIG